ncbi:MAG: ribbon-helix-helix domain-containing protein [Candidatus Bathyarchaeia archaeon]
MKLITLHLPETYLKELDSLVNERLYYSRADAIRSAVRDLLSSEVWERRPNGFTELEP